jgi:hypothetical protein
MACDTEFVTGEAKPDLEYKIAVNGNTVVAKEPAANRSRTAPGQFGKLFSAYPRLILTISKPLG